MKKFKLLAPILGVTTLAATVPAVASCNSQVKTLSVVSTKTYKVGDTLTKDDLQISFDGSKLASSNWKLMNGSKEIQTYIFTNDTAVTFTVVYENNKTTFDVKAEKDGSIYEKENSYLLDNAFMDTTINCTTYNARFILKTALKDGESLKAEIVEDQEQAEKIIGQTTIDLTNYTFDNTVFVPIKHRKDYITKSYITKFSLKISCVKGTTTVWSDQYDPLWVRFNVYNVWAGKDHYGFTNDVTRMTNAWYTHHTSAPQTYTEAEYCMPFPIELREGVWSNETLHVAVYNSTVTTNTTHQPVPGVTFGLQPVTVGTTKNYVRGDWDYDSHSYSYSFENINSNLEKDTIPYGYDKCYNVFLSFQGTSEALAAMPDHAVAAFDLVLWTEYNNPSTETHKYRWVETITGCRMMYIPSSVDQK